MRADTQGPITGVNFSFLDGHSIAAIDPPDAAACPVPFGWRWPSRLVATAEDISPTNDDPPPLKWSDLRYVSDIQEDYNGKEALQA